MLEHFDKISVGLALVRPNGRFKKVNKTLRSFLRQPEGALERMSFHNVTFAEDLSADCTQFESVLRGDLDSYTMEKRYHNTAGDTLWAKLGVTVLRDGFGAAEMFVSTVTDIQAQKTREARLQMWASQDPLTGLLNRRAFDKEAALCLRTAKREGRSLTLFVIDVNGLKEVNDTAGHARGDMVIKTVGRHLERLAGQDALVSRFGGDEFAVLSLPTSPDGFAARFSQRMRDEPIGFWERRNVPRPISVSFGMCHAPSEASAVEEMVQLADQRMYRQKRSFKAL